jgi:hypothetical protein
MIWRRYVEHPATGKLDIEGLKRLGMFKIFDRLNHIDAGTLNLFSDLHPSFELSNHFQKVLDFPLVGAANFAMTSTLQNKGARYRAQTNRYRSFIVGNMVMRGF